MNFEIKHLLNYEQIEELINNESPNDRADIICENLKYYCFTNKGELYKFDSVKVIYKKIETTIDEELITVISKYITESIKQLKSTNFKFCTCQIVKKNKSKDFVSGHIKSVKS